MPAKLTQERFLAKCKEVHGDTYDYSEVIYVKSTAKVAIRCKLHGVFFQKADGHLSGKGCNACGYLKTSEKTISNKEAFLSKAKLLHKDTYTYSNVVYRGSKVKVAITCKTHGDFLLIPNSHLMGGGCSKCSHAAAGKARRSNTESFIEKATKVHGSKYSYEKVEYVTNYLPVNITCPVHKEFLQTPNSHLTGGGCDKCYRERSTKYNTTLAERNKEEFLQTPSGIYVMAMKGLGADSIYKVGVSNGVERRLGDLGRQIGHAPTLLYYAPSNLYDSIIAEQGLHDALSEFSYTSPIKFGGYTECFSLPDETATDLIEYLNETFGEDTEIHE